MSNKVEAQLVVRDEIYQYQPEEIEFNCRGCSAISDENLCSSLENELIVVTGNPRINCLALNAIWVKK